MAALVSITCLITALKSSVLVMATTTSVCLITFHADNLRHNNTANYFDANAISAVNQINLNRLMITSGDIRSNASSSWTGNPGAQGKIQYHSIAGTSSVTAHLTESFSSGVTVQISRILIATVVYECARLQSADLLRFKRHWILRRFSKHITLTQHLVSRFRHQLRTTLGYHST